MCRGLAPRTRGISAEEESLRVSLMEWLAPNPSRFHESGGEGDHSFQQPQPLSGPLCCYAECPEGHSGLRPAQSSCDLVLGV